MLVNALSLICAWKIPGFSIARDCVNQLDSSSTRSLCGPCVSTTSPHTTRRVAADDSAMAWTRIVSAEGEQRRGRKRDVRGTPSRRSDHLTLSF